MLVPQMTQVQLRAATTNRPLCYVKAGPGSGKTFLAAEAFGYLRFVRHRDAPGGVVGVTFARSARKELEDRVRVRWGARAVGWPNAICTFDELHRRLVRYLVHQRLIDWPGGSLPDRPQDSWAMHDKATSRPGKQSKCLLTLDDEGVVTVRKTKSKRLAPTPAFTDEDSFLSALASGYCTHSDVRNVLSAAIGGDRHPRYAAAIRDCLAGSVSHLVVDEAFDMNSLDIAVVGSAIQAGVPVTIVGDPWQSLYEFRGSSPKGVRALLDAHDFEHLDMPGTHRYTTAEMLHLSQRLFDGEPFRVRPAEAGDEFDVVLAHDWGALWAERRIPVLPAGIPSKIDRGKMASCFILLVNEVVRAQFGHEASGLAEAKRAIGSEDPSPFLAPAVETLRDPDSPAEAVWDALRDAFQPSEARPWPVPGKKARDYLEQLSWVVRRAEPPALGLSVHQAKGLEWDRVLFLDGELTTASGKANVLDVDQGSHRAVYVGLTRARSAVRVLRVQTDPFGHERSPIAHVTIADDT
ncbi:MAG: ATP-dependent helicase [Acidimicrobiales bacterium]|nr:ATP-dependent helicase [Acidimicrobiales bacterium]